MKDTLKTPCKDCPFRRNAARGWLGAYQDAEQFLAVHYRHDEQNPCHMTVDYSDPDWQAKLPQADACVGQQIMYLNSCKRPRTWQIPDDLDKSDDVFQWPHEFMDHHQREL